jgi:hypothetical protein
VRAFARSFNHGLHRVHRWLGSVLCLLLAMWFASGAVMTFARYPSYQTQERLRDAEPLSSIDAVLPDALAAFIRSGGLASGTRARLAQLEGEPTWLWTTQDGLRVAQRARAPHVVSLLNEQRVAREVMRRRHVAAEVQETLDSYDQWTVAAHFRGYLPLSRVSLADGRGSELYVSLRSGEIVQESTRQERWLAWLGPIPHWIYPAALRAQRSVWRTTVLTLSTFGLILTLSGLFVGFRVAHARRQRGLAALRDPVLRWHQRLGLSFGALVCTWLASGALSLSPFGLNRGPYPGDADLKRLHGSGVPSDVLRIDLALENCRRVLVPRELELVQLGRHVAAVCSDRDENTRIVDLTQERLEPRRELAGPIVREVLGALDAQGVLAVQRTRDAYYYPSHADPQLPFPVVTFDDARGSRFYFDAARGELRAKHDAASRRDRWLYNALHSFDWPWLYAHRTAWRTLVVLAMTFGCVLSMLGFVMFARRQLRRRRSRRRLPQTLSATSPETSSLTSD